MKTCLTFDFKMVVGCTLKMLKWGVVIGLFVFVIHFWLCNKSYLLTEEDVASVARKYVGKDPVASFDQIHQEFAKLYPGHILPKKDLQWIFMNAGGWMGAMCIIHASVTEYILFFGSAIDTNGHSGRYWANVTDTILTGEFRQWEEGKLTVNVHSPGATIKHVWGEVTAVDFKAGTWMVEYGRGFIPSTLGFALADTVFSTQDFVTMFYIFRVYAKAMLQEVVFNVVHLLA